MHSEDKSRHDDQRRCILAVGVYPPPIHGQSEMFRILVDGMSLDYQDLSMLGYTGDGTSNAARAIRIFRAWRECFKLLKTKRVLYISTAQSLAGFLRDFGFFVAARARGAKVIAHWHNNYFVDSLPRMPWLFRKLVHRVYAKVDRVVLLSESFRPWFPFLRDEQILVCSNGVAAVNEIGVRSLEPKVRLLFLSNMMPGKGVLELIDAMEFLPRNYELDLCGGYLVTEADPFADVEEFRAAVEQRLAHESLRSRVRCHGVVSGGAKSALLDRAHVIVLPTKIKTEGQPLTVFEALMAGIPVVASRVGDLPNMVPPAVGLTIDEVTPYAIADAVVRLTADDEKYRAMSQAARRFAVERYSTSAHLMRMGEIFDEVLKGVGDGR